jgi:hypothetical protein
VLLLGGALASTAASARVGGYMGSCYLGSGFRTGEVCESSSAEATSALDAEHEVKVSAYAAGRYTQPSGESVAVDLTFTLEDPSNYFDPEGRLPLLVRVIVAGYHRDPPSYRVVSTPVSLTRVEGQRRLGSAPISVTLRNNWGAEYVEHVEKVEVLVPGFPSVLVLDL